MNDMHPAHMGRFRRHRFFGAVCAALAAFSFFMTEVGLAGPAAAGVRSISKAQAGAPVAEQSERIRSRVFEGGAAVSDVVFLKAPSREELREPDPNTEEKGALRIGILRPLPEPYVFAAAKRPTWSLMRDSSRVWAVIVQSESAEGIRINLDNIRLPKGGRLLATSLSNPEERVGPYGFKDIPASGSFWTETIFSDAVVLECQVEADADENEVSFDIARIAHLYVPFSELAHQVKVGKCHNDVTCAAASWRNVAQGVAGIGTVGLSGYLWCTGTLLNNTAEDFVDYFLTAHHCVQNQGEADSTEYYWFYQTSTCNGSAPHPSTVPRTGGGAVFLEGRSRSTGSDFALLRLQREPPGGVTYAGWSAADPGSSASVGGIHHPDGSFKRISYGAITGTPGNYWRVVWSSGVTEAGSSGSPLFNSAQQVIGQLWGGSSSCTFQSFPDEYGRFDVTLPFVTQWLQPAHGGPVNNPFANATIISGPSGQANGSNVGATKEAGEPDHAGNAGGRSVWWRWTAQADGQVGINTFGSNFDTLLAAYTGDSVDSLTVVASNDDDGGGVQSRMTFDAAAGVTYRIAVDGYNGAVGEIVLNWTSAEAPGGVTRINTGGTAVAPWDEDRDFSGKSGTYRVSRTIRNAGDVPQKALRCIRYAVGSRILSYSFPEIPPGQYTVRLHFADIYSTRSGMLRFHVEIEGKRVLKRFDVYAAAGGRDRRIVREFQTTVDSDGLQLKLTPFTGAAFINALELIPLAGGVFSVGAEGGPDASAAYMPKVRPIEVWTSGNRNQEHGGWNAVDGDCSTAWIGDRGADRWWIALGYRAPIPVTGVRVFHAEDSLTNMAFIGSRDGIKWFDLDKALSSGRPADTRYLWIQFAPSGDSRDLVPNLLEIEVDRIVP